jgi:outer membrane protein
MQALQEQYAAEQKRVEDEFNKKYEEFLDGQRDFPQTILQKRQMELQELMEKNIAFKKESQRLLAEAREKAMQPLKTRLADALARVGSSRGLAFIINTDQNALPWMNITMGEDVTEAVLEALK